MKYNFNRKRLVDQIIFVKRCFDQTEGLPFNKIFSREEMYNVVQEEVNPYRDRLYPPLTTLQTFLSQVLSSDHSCRDAVMRVIAERINRGEEPCSSDSSSYCAARKRLPTSLVMRLLRKTGNALHEQSAKDWRWKGRSVKLIDGTTVSMPDTPENQKAYPQQKAQKPGLGFPIARLVAIISLSSGAVLDIAMGPYEGKKTGEHALLRKILNCLSSGDVVVADRYYCTYWLISLLVQMGVDIVFQSHACRKSDFRLGKHLGKKDHLVTWEKPQRPQWMDKKIYQAMPEELTVRETRVSGKTLISTFLDPKEVSRKEIGMLYTKRWFIEVDLRSIKNILQMDILRCKTSEMVRKEISVHLLAYNLIRTVMAQAASRFGVLPRTVSFKGTIQIMNAFRDKILLAREEDLPELFEQLLHGIIRHRVGHRLGRCEPRAVKRRPKQYSLLMEPRQQARNRLLLYQFA